MEYWNSHPTESDLSFAQTTQSNISTDLDWGEDCSLGDIPLPEETSRNSLLDTKPLPGPVKLLEELTTSHVSLEFSPEGKKIKIESPISARSKLYEGWLQELEEIVKELPAGHETLNGLISQNLRLPELIKLVMAELKHKLALDDFKTQGSEHSFWVSVQAMASKCGVDYGYFWKLCCSSICKDVTIASDCSLPRLVDQGHDVPLVKLATYPSVGYSNMISSSEAFQEFPLATVKNEARTTPSSSSFGRVNCPKFQRHIYTPMSAKHSEQVQQLYPPSSLYSAFSSSKVIPLKNSNTRVSMPNGNSFKKKAAQCLSNYLDRKDPISQFPAIVPESCKRRIQRHRKRAMSYDHLSTNFGASAISPVWNTKLVEPSDLQFLLEKELKPSDVGSLGRIILPKRQAEEKLPHLEAKEGLRMLFQDMQTSQIWDLRFRYWPNNKTRMYLLECTGKFVKSHQLQEGDLIALYKNPATGTYMIDGKKAAWPKCLGTSGRKGLPAPCQTGKSDYKLSPEPVQVQTTKAPGSETAISQQGLQSGIPQQTMACERDCSSVGETDLMAACDLWDMEDPDELIKGFSELEEDGKSIEELFGFEE